jgi:hypothetical protein
MSRESRVLLLSEVMTQKVANEQDGLIVNDNDETHFGICIIYLSRISKSLMSIWFADEQWSTRIQHSVHWC